jgi:hypothetical protein
MRYIKFTLCLWRSYKAVGLYPQDLEVEKDSFLPFERGSDQQTLAYSATSISPLGSVT